MNASQKRAVENHRRRLGERGMARYEVRGLARDKELIREFAKRLAQDDPEAGHLRKRIANAIAVESRRGGIWAALRSSPAVGANLDLTREIVPERDVDL